MNKLTPYQYRDRFFEIRTIHPENYPGGKAEAAVIAAKKARSERLHRALLAVASAGELQEVREIVGVFYRIAPYVNVEE